MGESTSPGMSTCEIRNGARKTAANTSPQTVVVTAPRLEVTFIPETYPPAHAKAPNTIITSPVQLM